MRRAVAALGILVLGSLSWFALAHAWADILVFQGRAAINEWQAARRPPDEGAWTLLHQRLGRALALSPRDAYIREEFGRAYEMRARSTWPPTPQTTGDLQAALEHFRHSVSHRPTSPYAWSSIALVKSGLQQLDAELFRAIENAARLGPWEPEVQIALASIGFSHWQRLPPATRATVQAAMQRGLKRHDGTLFELATRYRRLDVLCTTPGIARSRHALRCI